MKSRVCINCGSTEFHRVEDGWQCDYCGTLYLDTNQTSQPQAKTTKKSSTKRKNRGILGAVLLVALLIIGSVSYLTFKADSDSTSASSFKPIKSNVTTTEKGFPNGWNHDIYDSIKVATEHYDAETEKYSYSGGASYQELEKIVGSPDTVTSWEKEEDGIPARVQASWNKTKDGDYSTSTVNITYNKKTGMITDKGHY